MPVPENEDKCTKCQLCVMMCPDQAIKVDEKVDEKGMKTENYFIQGNEACARGAIKAGCFLLVTP